MENVKKRSQIAEGMAVLAVVIALITSLSVYAVNNRAINRNEDAISQIQQSRVDNTLNACQETNKRHRDSLAFLTKLGKTIVKKDPSKKAEVQEGIKNYNFLFDAFLPIQDCKALVKKRFG